MEKSKVMIKLIKIRKYENTGDSGIRVTADGKPIDLTGCCDIKVDINNGWEPAKLIMTFLVQKVDIELPAETEKVEIT
jgi:hypothetical protein